MSMCKNAQPIFAQASVRASRFIAGCRVALVRVNKNTAAYYYHRLRELIYRAVADAAPFAGEIEVDESYSGGRRKNQAASATKANAIPVLGGMALVKPFD